MLIKAFIVLVIVCIALLSCCTIVVKGVVILVGINVVNFCFVTCEIFSNKAAISILPRSIICFSLP